MTKVGIGIVGAGLVSDSHAEGYIRNQNADIIAVCDLNRDVAEHKAKSWNAKKVYTDYEQMLKDPEIQAVDIMTPPVLHHDMSIKAAESGKHVNCEKPFCNSIAEGKEIREAAMKNGVILAVDESYLFTTAHMKARELIASGAIGEPLQIRHYKGDFVQREEGLVSKRRLTGSRGEERMWRADPVKSGGGDYPWVFDHAVHLFATTQYLMMDLEVDSIMGFSATYSGKSGSDAYTAEDYKDIPIIAWQFKDRQKQGFWVRAEKRAHNTYNNRTGFSSVVLGSKGMLEVLGEGGGGLLYNGTPAHLLLHSESGKVETMTFEEGGDRIWDSGISYYDQAHINEVTHFIECILKREKPRYGGEEATREIGLTLSAIKSAIDGSPVQVDRLGDDFKAYDLAGK
jgi:predicted dehydrogenase